MSYSVSNFTVISFLKENSKGHKLRLLYSNADVSIKCQFAIFQIYFVL